MFGQLKTQIDDQTAGNPEERPELLRQYRTIPGGLHERYSTGQARVDAHSTTNSETLGLHIV
jgi:hypothetical protein